MVNGSLRPLEAAELIRDLHDAVENELPRGQFIGSGLGVENVIGLYYAFDGVESPANRDALELELRQALAAVAAESSEAY